MIDDRPPWVEGLTIPQVFAQTVARHGDQEALVFSQAGLRATYAEFDRLVYEAAKGLLALDVRRGEHVAVWGTNVPEWVILQFATARIGAVLVTINPAYRSFELDFVLRQSDAVALFLVDRFKSSDYLAMLREVCPELPHSLPGDLQSERFPRLRAVGALRGAAPAGVLPWHELLDRGRMIDRRDLEQASRELTPEQTINIQYTSGTTGFPKAAMLSHRNLLLNSYYVGQRQRMSAADRMCIPVPFYHCFGCSMGTMCAVVHGATMIIPAEYFEPAATLDAVERERATTLYGVPTMFIAQLQDASFPRRDLTSLRSGIMAGSPCPIEIMRQVVDKMGVREVTIAYGQTEASPVITQTAWDDPLELRVETVGMPLPGLEVKLVDPESGQELSEHEQGELCARGHAVMSGYYQDPVASQKAIDAEGWLHTGDLATRLPNGYYRITGRLKDMVIRGGENIYPREIEEYLFRHPAVEQVAVVGVPDAKYGEELCAWVKLKPGASALPDELREYCRLALAHYKVPRYVQLVAEFPQTVTGKIQKFKIRECVIADLGLSEPETA
ncbi:MAG: AMP-binding protein [Pirellulales bacterium]|nr:AMP-binding protein [Pirellulales bacterium]